ncbi:MAG: BREX system P-loop protein BrxC, partial [bacterium]|nr:BREX system P-loop protein BrxC [bacterium]
KWRRVVVIQRITTRPEEIQKARRLGKQVFGEMGPDGEDALFAFLRAKAKGWREQLTGYRSLAETGNYPGRAEIAGGLSELRALLAADESNKFLGRLNERSAELLDLCDDFHDLEQFYDHQRLTWDQLRAAVDRFELNRLELDRNAEARSALRRMREILEAPSPYGLIQETECLMRTVREVNEALLAESHDRALQEIDTEMTAMIWEFGKIEGAESLRVECLRPLERLRERIAS